MKVLSVLIVLMLASFTEQWFFKDLGLTPFIHKPIGKLSGGFQKIATITCALSIKPDGFFLDEPISGLDQEKEEIFIKIFEDVCKSATFIIITSHSTIKLSSASFEITLKEGKIQCEE